MHRPASCKIVKCDLFHFPLLSKTHFLWHKHGYYYPALHVFGSEVVVARGPVTTAGSLRYIFSSKQRNRSSLDGEMLRQQTQPVYWVVLERTTIDLTTRRCSRASDWIYCANMVPSSASPINVKCFLALASVINLIFALKHWLILNLSAFSQQHVSAFHRRFGCWRKVWALRFLRFFSLEAVDKGKGEALMFWQQFAILIDGGERFKHQTDMKKQIAFMNSKIYSSNKSCWAPPNRIYGIHHGLSVDLWQRSGVHLHKGSMKY